MQDIYFLPAYGELNERIEGGKSQIYDFTCEYGRIRSVFIKRAIPILLEGEQYYDAVTPYGYGGPLVIESTDREKLLAAYTENYRVYCRKQRIVDEFVRFHPLSDNALDFGGLYQTTYNRHTIAVDLTDEDYSRTQFTPDCRNMIRKAEKKGVKIEIDEACLHLDDFIRLYYGTMDKNKASDYYYFDRSYFEQLRAIEGCDVILINGYVENRIISSAMFLLSGSNMHYHLSSTDREYYSFASNNAILSCAAAYGRAHGMHWLHLGGGLSSDEKDRLYKFKRSFGRMDRNLKDFYIGKAVFLPEEYIQLCALAQNSEMESVDSSDFFPAYRKAH